MLEESHSFGSEDSSPNNKKESVQSVQSKCLDNIESLLVRQDSLREVAGVRVKPKFV